MGITCSVRTLAIICLSGCFNHAWYSHLFSSCFTEYSKRGECCRKPKGSVHGRDCLIRLHTMTVHFGLHTMLALMLIILKTHVCPSLLYLQSTHSFTSTKDTSTIAPAPPYKEASTIPPAPTEKEAGTIPPAPTEKEAGTIPPAPTEKDICTTLPAPTETGRYNPASSHWERGWYDPREAYRS